MCLAKCPPAEVSHYTPITVIPTGANTQILLFPAVAQVNLTLPLNSADVDSKCLYNFATLEHMLI